MLKALEHPRLDLLAPDGVAVGACAATIVVGAAVAVFDQDRVAPTAGPAREQPRQQLTLSVHAAQAVRVMRANALGAGRSDEHTPARQSLLASPAPPCPSKIYTGCQPCRSSRRRARQTRCCP